METFTLHDLNEENTPQEQNSEFVIYFDDREDPVERPENTLNVEEEARRIFEEAFAQGEKAGQEMGLKKVEPLVKRLGGCIAELSMFKEELVKRAERLSTELAFLFAEAIVLRECRENHDTVLKMVRKALSFCEERSGTTIRMRREDLKHISSEDLSSFKIVKDDTINEPGFVIETNFGDIDGRVSVQVEELRKEYLNGSVD